MKFTSDICLNQIKPNIIKTLSDSDIYNIKNKQYIRELIEQAKECERLLNISSEVRYINLICLMILFIVIISCTIYVIYIKKINILDIANNILHNFRESIIRARAAGMIQTPRVEPVADNIQPVLRRSPRRRK